MADGNPSLPHGHPEKWMPQKPNGYCLCCGKDSCPEDCDEYPYGYRDCEIVSAPDSGSAPVSVPAPAATLAPVPEEDADTMAHKVATDAASAAQATVDEETADTMWRIESGDLDSEDIDTIPLSLMRSLSFMTNRAVVLAAVKRFSMCLAHLCDDIKDDASVVCAALSEGHGCALKFASARLRADKDVVLKAVQSDGVALNFASEDLKGDRDVVLAAVRRGVADEDDYEDLEIDVELIEPLWFAEQFWNDREVVLAAVSTTCHSFRHASVELRRDKEIVLAAVEHEPTVLGTLDADIAAVLLNDREFASVVVEKHPCALKLFSDTLRGDRELVLRAITKTGDAIKFASEDLRADKALALVAIRAPYTCPTTGCCNTCGDGTSVRFSCRMLWPELWLNTFAHLSCVLRNDKDVVLAAITTHSNFMNASSFSHVSDRLRGDREVVLAYFNQVEVHVFAESEHKRIMEHIPTELKNDRKLMMKAISKVPNAFEFADETLKSDRKFVLEAVSHRGEALRSVSTWFRQDKEIVLCAVQQNGCALQYAEAALQANREVVVEAVKQNGNALRHASTALRASKSVVLIALLSSSSAFNYASIALRRDSDVVKAAVFKTSNKYSAEAILHESGKLKNDATFLQSLLFRAIENTTAQRARYCKLETKASQLVRIQGATLRLRLAPIEHEAKASPNRA